MCWTSLAGAVKALARWKNLVTSNGPTRKANPDLWRIAIEQAELHLRRRFLFTMIIMRRRAWRRAIRRDCNELHQCDDVGLSLSGGGGGGGASVACRCFRCFGLAKDFGPYLEQRFKRTTETESMSFRNICR